MRPSNYGIGPEHKCFTTIFPWIALIADLFLFPTYLSILSWYKWKWRNCSSVRSSVLRCR